MRERKNPKRKMIKVVYWVCDKEGCNTGNTREILQSDVINDDVCDYCHERIHEPVTIDINNDKH